MLRAGSREVGSLGSGELILDLAYLWSTRVWKLPSSWVPTCSSAEHVYLSVRKPELSLNTLTLCVHAENPLVEQTPSFHHSSLKSRFL